MKTEKKKEKKKRKKVLTDGLSEIGYQHQRIDVQARKCFLKTSLNILQKKTFEKMKVMISLSSLFSMLLCKTVFDWHLENVIVYFALLTYFRAKLICFWKREKCIMQDAQDGTYYIGPQIC